MRRSHQEREGAPWHYGLAQEPHDQSIQGLDTTDGGGLGPRGWGDACMQGPLNSVCRLGKGKAGSIMTSSLHVEDSEET